MKLSNLMLGALLVLPLAPLQAEEPVDYEMINKIIDEGFNRSQVMETLNHLTDVIGPRLTNNPGMLEAAYWTRTEFET